MYVSGIKYNAEKDEKEKQSAKQKKLQALEEAKKLEAEKGEIVQVYPCKVYRDHFYMGESYKKLDLCTFAKPKESCCSISGPGCSKLTTLLVNVLLKFQKLITEIHQYFY